MQNLFDWCERFVFWLAWLSFSLQNFTRNAFTVCVQLFPLILNKKLRVLATVFYPEKVFADTVMEFDDTCPFQLEFCCRYWDVIIRPYTYEGLGRVPAPSAVAYSVHLVCQQWGSHCVHTTLLCSGSRVPTITHCMPTALWARVPYAQYLNRTFHNIWTQPFQFAFAIFPLKLPKFHFHHHDIHLFYIGTLLSLEHYFAWLQ